MPELAGVTFTGARQADALSSFAHKTVRSVYAPAGVFSGALSIADGHALHDVGARGFLSGTGTPALGAGGALVLDWRVVGAPNPSATLAQAAALLNDAARTVGARLTAVTVGSSAGSIDTQAAGRQAAAAAGSSSVPTIGGALASGASSVGKLLESLAGWLVLFIVLGLVGLYLWTQR